MGPQNFPKGHKPPNPFHFQAPPLVVFLDARPQLSSLAFALRRSRPPQVHLKPITTDPSTPKEELAKGLATLTAGVVVEIELGGGRDFVKSVTSPPAGLFIRPHTRDRLPQTQKLAGSQPLGLGAGSQSVSAFLRKSDPYENFGFNKFHFQFSQF